MKVFMAKNISCGVNSEYYELLYALKDEVTCEFVFKPEEADVIIFSGTCSCHEERIIYVVNYIDSIISRKKDGAKTYLTGCMAREFTGKEKTDVLSKWLDKNIDVIVPNNRVIDLLRELYYEKFKDVEFEAGFPIPGDNSAAIFLTRGCMHKCSFCKTTFQNIPLISMDFDSVKEYIDMIDEDHIEVLDFRGMNICEFGLDTKGEYLLPDAIEYAEKKKNIKSIKLVGFAYADAIEKDFKYVIRESKKVDYIVGSLESGVNRILKLMNKGYKVEDFLDFVFYINQEYRKLLDINIIAGFPTETMDDVKRTMKVLKEIKDFLALVTVCRYSDSAFVASHKLEQHSKDVIQEHAKIYSKFLKSEGVSTILL